MTARKWSYAAFATAFWSAVDTFYPIKGFFDFGVHPTTTENWMMAAIMFYFGLTLYYMPDRPTGRQ